ncbi:ABC transporter substrate-binding protein [Paenibacillus ginsengarvi]|nr:extracellular solute-binding protein [Paenibacillus ginsengarvi]
MKKERRFTAIPPTLLAAAMLLASCSGGGTAATGGDKTDSGSLDKNKTALEGKPKEPVEVVFYAQNGMTPADFDNRFGNSLRKKFPNYTIKYIQNTGKGMDVPGMLASNTHYDVYFAYVGYFENEFISYDLQFDMSELIKQHQLDLNRIDPSVISGIRNSSYGMYALPVITDTLGIMYNKDILDKFGVPYPKNGITWGEIIDMSRKLTRTEGDKTYAGYVPFTNYMLSMNPLSIPLVDEKTGTPTINRDERWKKFYQTLLIAPSEVPGIQEYLKKHEVIDGFFKDQEVAMIGGITAFAANSREDQLSKFNWDWVALPSFQDLPNVGGQPYTQYFGITRMAKSKNTADAAMEMLKYLVSDEFQTEVARKGFMPVLKNLDVRKVFGQDTKVKDKNWNAYFYNKLAEVPYKSVNEMPIASLYVANMNQVMKGEIDLNTALRLSEESAAKKLQELKAK